ncbi:hypothetical protein DASB73_019040 [Starmerella bacillaris]|uniref:Gem-associated protein 2 n=1 Tax=Starmerella bacillaris TaxID=1247836 RepID=A0AAV5RIG0_STABA|nr:hypothetical protein DASB73_019040 [Starmerella bacillaris]
MAFPLNDLDDHIKRYLENDDKVIEESLASQNIRHNNDCTPDQGEFFQEGNATNERVWSRPVPESAGLDYMDTVISVHALQNQTAEIMQNQVSWTTTRNTKKFEDFCVEANEKLQQITIEANCDSQDSWKKFVYEEKCVPLIRIQSFRVLQYMGKAWDIDHKCLEWAWILLLRINLPATSNEISDLRILCRKIQSSRLADDILARAFIEAIVVRFHQHDMKY